MRMYNYLNIVSEQMRCKRARPAVLKELKDHIEDQKDDYMTAGMTAQEAEEEAVRQMGDPVEVGVSLDRLHRTEGGVEAFELYFSPEHPGNGTTDFCT